MPKKRKDEEAEAEEAVEHDAVPKKKKKKKAAAAATGGEDAAAACEDEAELADVVPKKKKRKKNSIEEEAPQDAAAKAESTDDAAPKKKKKKKDAAEEAPADNDVDGDEENSIKTVFVRGLPWSVTEEVLRKDFSECGEIADLEMVYDKVTGKPKGIAFVTYKDEAGVKAALAYDGDDYGGRRLEVRRETAKGKGKGKSKGKDHNIALEVFVRGLGAKTTEKWLQKHFAKCGEIERLKMDVDIGNGCACKGYAWITFTTKEGMEEAIALDGSDFKGNTITVEKSGEHKSGGKTGAGKGADAGGGIEVFIRGLPRSTEEDVVKKDFAECGEIVRMNMPKDPDGSHKGFAWIIFKTKEAADKAVEFNGDDYGGNKLLVEVAGQHRGKDSKGKGKGKGKFAPGPKPAGCRSVVVKKLSYEATDADLTKLFAKCGSGPVDIKILTDWETGKSKGIAFVDFDSEKSVDEAMKLAGSSIRGLSIIMDYAKPRETE